jgi:RHS repeat-associated protein
MEVGMRHVLRPLGVTAVGLAVAALALTGAFAAGSAGTRGSGSSRWGQFLEGRARAGTNHARADRIRMAEAQRAMRVRTAWLSSSRARAQRVRSRMAFHGLPEWAARDLLTHDFRSELDSASANPAAAVAAAGPVVRYIDNKNALVRKGRQLELESSSVPLRVANGGGLRPVDLRLRATAGGFAAANPLQGVAVARRLRGGVAIGPGGLRFVPQGADATGSLIDGRSVFFGDIGPDEDASVAPTIDGADLSAVLRSRLSPELISYRVLLPPGARMRASNGGVSISGGGIVANVSPPSAKDAQGQSVPVQMTVSGDRILLHVSHRQRDLAYPVMVDPTVTTDHCCGEWTFKGAEWERMGFFTDSPPWQVADGSIEAEAANYGGDNTVGELWNNVWGEEHGWRDIRTVFYGVEYQEAVATNGAVMVGTIAGMCYEWTSSRDGAPPSTLVFPSKQYEEHERLCEPNGFGMELRLIPENGGGTEKAAYLKIGAVLITARSSTFSPEPEEEYAQGNPSTPQVKRACSTDPVNCATGNLVESQTDVNLGGRGIPLNVTRTYNAMAAVKQPFPELFGYGWSGSSAAHVVTNPEAGTTTVVQGSGSTAVFAGTSGVSGELVPLEWNQGKLVYGTEPAYTFTLPDQEVFTFDSSGLLLNETDRKGNTTIFKRNSKGRLEAITDSSGRSLAFAYNSEGEVESITDPMGHVVKYSYEGGNLTSVTEPGAKTPRWQLKYDASHRLTTMIDGCGGVTIDEYDKLNRVISQTDPAKRTTTFEYEPGHTKLTNQSTGSVLDEHFTFSNEPESITRGFGTSSATTETFTYGKYGEVLTAKDGNGHKTEYEYDGEHNQTKLILPLGGLRKKWTYNSTHDIATMTTPEGEVTTCTRNSAGEPEKISRPAPGGGEQVVQYKYDSHGDLESLTDPLGHTWRYEYDSHGDRTGETDPEGDKRTWEYNEDSRVISRVSARGNAKGAEPSRYTTATERDAQGRPLTITDPLGHTKRYSYDANGNLETMTNANGGETKYSYGPDNELTKVVQPNGATTETGYDSAGQVISQTDGDGHTTKYVRNPVEAVTEIIDPRQRRTTKAYDSAGNMLKITDALGRVTTNTYDSDNRLTKASYSDGKTHTVEYAYNEDGHLKTIKDGTGTTSYTYNPLELITEIVNGHGERLTYEYDLANEQTKLTYPSKNTITRGYDEAGRLKTVSDWLGHQTKLAYDPDSDVTAINFPAGTGNQDKYTYDEAGRMNEAQMTKGAEALATLVYQRDNAGQIKTTTSKGLPGEEKISAGYDANSRLTKAGTTSYGYDAANNPLKLGSGTYTYDSANQLKAGNGVKYAYDEVGQRLKSTPSTAASTYGYDQEGNLISLERAAEGKIPALKDTFAYDGSGLRASQTLAGTTTHLAWDPTADGPPPLLSDETNSYIYGPNGLPIEQINNKQSKVLYLHHDQQDSTRLLTGSTGASEGTITYDPYGNTTATKGASISPLGYDAQYTNTDTGLIYLRARTYDPTTAQFLSVDPMLSATGEPYTYAEDNPLSGADPTGLANWLNLGIPSPGEILEPLNPIKYYEAEIKAYENGCSYWDAITHGLNGAAIAAADAAGVGALAEGIAGLLTREGLPAIDDLLAGLDKGHSANVYEVDTPEELQAIYDKYSRGGEPATSPKYKGEMVKLPDGTRIGLRTDSTSGGPTIDIKQPGKPEAKIHLP